MKKALIIIVSFVYLQSFAQFTFTDHAGNAIINGSTVSYSTANSENAKLKFYITNVGTAPVDVRIQCTGINGGNGVGFQLCYAGLCHDNVVPGGIYPDYQFLLNTGENNGNFDYFVNNFVSPTPIDFNFQVYGLDGSGFPTGQSITFTYRYDSTLGLNSLSELATLGVKLTNTIVKNELNFNATVSGKVALVNLSGQQMGEFSFTEGEQSLNLSNLSAGVYIANFITTEGKTLQLKLLKN